MSPSETFTRKKPGPVESICTCKSQLNRMSNKIMIDPFLTKLSKTFHCLGTYYIVY